MDRAAKSFFIALALSLVLAGPVHAQTATPSDAAIRISPALYEQVVNPGDRFSTSMNVTNPTAAAVQVTVGVQDISGLDGSGNPIFSSTTVPEYGLSSWVGISQTEVTLPAHGSVSIPFTITVPRTAVPGGHYGAIFISFGATRPVFNGTGIGYQVGSLIDLRISGTANEQADVTEFATDKSLYQSPDVTFTATIADTGNVLLRPRGPIDITNMFGQKVATVIMNDSNQAVFPSGTQSFTAGWAGKGFEIGRFDAVMSLTYGDNADKTTSASLEFWVIPVIPIIAVLASIIFFIVIFVWSIKAYVRKRVNAMVGGGERHGRSSISEEEKFLSEGRLPFSRLVFIAIATAVFALIFLIVLFLLFG